MKKIILFMSLFLTFASQSYGQQTTISGLVKDAFGQPVPAASVKLIDAKNKGTFTNFNGEFELKSPMNKGKIEISSIGFKTQTLNFDDSLKKLNIVLKSSSVGLNEVLLFSSTAIDRKTPVAVSTVKKEDIELKLGSQEFVEIFKSTPGVYTSKGGGGFGDGEIQMRGFNSENVGVLINGVPVNDMENGRVYWSNWIGLASVTASTQTQRGLGASKVAVPAIGGTISTITETTDVEEGGFFTYGLGNDGYNKYGLKYSTGLMNNGFAATVYADRTYGNGFVDGTEFNGISYFANISYKINDAHKLSFTTLGAKQRHGQRQTKNTISTIRDSERGIKFNPDWGYKNGQVVNIEDNFYHKPQISLNHYWTINDKNDLTTTAYISQGTGGGGGTAGNFSYPRIGVNGPVDLDVLVDANQANGASTAILRASRNDHLWAGVLSTLKTEINENIEMVNGLDLRTYTGKHFQEVTDLLGGTHFIDDNNVNSPNRETKVGDKIAYNNDGIVKWLGAFSQIEYDQDQISAFVNVNVSNTSYKRIDYFQKTPGNQETDYVNFPAWGAKGGVNYRIDNYNNIFGNIGYFEKAPNFRAVWPSFNNDQSNENAENQKIFSGELGYGLRIAKLSVNVNLYHTRWNDRTYSQSFQEADGSRSFANITGVNAIHEGIEIDAEFRPIKGLKFTGMISIGDWRWENDIKNVLIIDENQNVVGDPINLYIKDVPVGRSAQTTAALGVNYTLAEKTTFVIDYNYAGRYFSDFDPNNRTTQGTPKPWEIPDYSLFDAIISHKFKIGTLDSKITARMNNVFDTEYISVSEDGNDNDAATANVWYGLGRTFTISTKINF